MGKIIDTSNYALCLVSLNELADFFKKNKIKSKKIVSYLQKNHETYLSSISEGIWLPILPINSSKYIVKIANLGENFDDKWEKKIEEKTFNLKITQDFWIFDIGILEELNEYDLSKDYTSYFTLDNIEIFNGFKFNFESGLYHVNIEGYKRKSLLDYPNANFGFRFTFEKTDKFDSYKDPRDDEKYFFNVAKT